MDLQRRDLHCVLSKFEKLFDGTPGVYPHQNIHVGGRSKAFPFRNWKDRFEVSNRNSANLRHFYHCLQNGHLHVETGRPFKLLPTSTSICFRTKSRSTLGIHLEAFKKELMHLVLIGGLRDQAYGVHTPSSHPRKMTESVQYQLPIIQDTLKKC